MATDDQNYILLVAFSACIVFIMQAGFALLETGMVRSKNAVNVLMKNYVDVCFVVLVFWAVGYGLMFGPHSNGYFVTSTAKYFVNSVDSIEMIGVFYQTMFAATTVTIVSGALAERIHFTAYILISILIAGLIYPVFGSWVWGEGGWLNNMGFVDFAGAAVVHSTGGWIALAGIIVLGPRLGRFGQDAKKYPILGHNLPLVAMGGLLLWFGWFGFNVGSVASLDDTVPKVLMNTVLAGAAGGAFGVLTMTVLRTPVLLTTTVVASIGGLVSITGGAATISLPFAVLTGAIGGILSVGGVIIMERMELDDAVGAVACHAIAGVWGTLAAGLFIEGNLFDMGQVVIQAIGAIMCFAWSFFGALALFMLVNSFYPIKATSSQQRRGLDFAEHYEIAYPEFRGNIVNPGKES